MKIDLSFWRFVIVLNFAKSLLWSKGDDTYLFHIGTFKSGEDTAVNIVILPMSLMMGYARKR